MEFISDTFNNREIALFIWFTIFIILLSLKKDIRKKDIRSSFAGVIYIFFKKKLFLYILTMTIYILALVVTLFKIGFWNIDLLKDTIYWYFGVSLVMFITANKANEDDNYFKKIIFDNLKLVLIIEFILNLYTFSLLIELIFIPVLIIIVMLHAFAENDAKYKIVSNFLYKILTVVVIVLFFYALFKIITDFQSFANIENLHSIIFTPLITILFLPIIYIFALIMRYETLFTHMNIFNDNQEALKYAKRKIFTFCHLNLRRLNRFIASEKIVRFDNEDDVDIILNKYRNSMKNTE